MQGTRTDALGASTEKGSGKEEIPPKGTLKEWLAREKENQERTKSQQPKGEGVSRKALATASKASWRLRLEGEP